MPSAGPSGDDDTDNRVIPEGLLVVISICALIITAMVLPPVDGGVLSDSGSIDEINNGSDNGTGDITESTENTQGALGEPNSGQMTSSSADTQSQSDSSQESSESTRSGYGSPRASTLAEPPESTAIGSIQPNSGQIAKIPLFTIESSRTGYWRQSVYTEYTGSTWASETESQPYTGSIPNNQQTTGQQTTRYEVTLLENTSSLPVLWQPESVNIQDNSNEIQVSTAGTFRTPKPLPKETTYTAQSAAPPRDPHILRGAGKDYPSTLFRQYTQIPEDTPSRVESFSDELTADAETPYETATVIEEWLEESKAYSLSASHERGRPIVDEFLFEMDQGYCQYFATAMTVMLRSQDIPARYVVGFAGGTQVSEDRYLITSDTGHAWVEVYFPTTGWIRFDPTPPGNLPTKDPQPPYNITLNRTVVAGAAVDVSVEKNNNPVVGAPVRINTERVGWTDASGSVTTELPYDSTVTVSARPPGDQGKYLNGQTVTTEDVSPPAVSGVPRLRGSSYQYKLSAPKALPGPIHDSGCSVQSEAVVKCQSQTNVSVDVTGPTVRGESVLVSTAIRGVPVQGGAVTLDGNVRGYTNSSGEFTLALDNITTGRHSVNVTRQAASGATKIRVMNSSPTSTPAQTRDSVLTTTSTPVPTPDSTASTQNNTSLMSITVTPQFGVLLPLTDAEITVMQSETPVSNATVTLSGSTVGQTGPNGTVGATIPLQQSVSVTAVGPNNTKAQQTISGLYRTAAGVLIGVSVLVIVGILLLRRNRNVIKSILWRIHAALSRIPVFVTDVFVKLTITITRVWNRLYRLLMRIRRFILTPRAHLSVDRFVDLITLSPRRIVSIFRRGVRTLFRVIKDKIQLIRSEEDVSGSPDSETDTEEAEAEPIVRKIWYVFARSVGPPQLRTKTPREVATYAINRGAPSKPVNVLTQIYCKTEYGVKTTSKSQLKNAKDAFQTIRSSLRNKNE